MRFIRLGLFFISLLYFIAWLIYHNWSSCCKVRINAWQRKALSFFCKPSIYTYPHLCKHECCKRCQQHLQQWREWPSCVATLDIMFSLAVILCEHVCMCIDVYDYTTLRLCVCAWSVSSCWMYSMCSWPAGWARGSMAIADCSLYIGQPL